MAIELAEKRYYMATTIPGATPGELTQIFLCRDPRTQENYWSKNGAEVLLLPDSEELWAIQREEAKKSIARFEQECEAYRNLSPEQRPQDPVGILFGPKRSISRFWVLEYDCDPLDPVNIDRPWFFYSLPTPREPTTQETPCPSLAS